MLGLHLKSSVRRSIIRCEDEEADDADDERVLPWVGVSTAALVGLILCMASKDKNKGGLQDGAQVSWDFWEHRKPDHCRWLSQIGNLC